MNWPYDGHCSMVLSSSRCVSHMLIETRHEVMNWSYDVLHWVVQVININFLNVCCGIPTTGVCPMSLRHFHNLCISEDASVDIFFALLEEDHCCLHYTGRQQDRAFNVL